MQPDDSNPPPTNESANTITIEDIRDEIIKLINTQDKSKPPSFQGKGNGET